MLRHLEAADPRMADAFGQLVVAQIIFGLHHHVKAVIQREDHHLVSGQRIDPLEQLFSSDPAHHHLAAPERFAAQPERLHSDQQLPVAVGRHHRTSGDSDQLIRLNPGGQRQQHSGGGQPYHSFS